jgi:phosphoribosylformylglycinamidine (FGAM) synthase-like enzyme
VAEKKAGDFVRGLVRAGRLTAAHDLSEGGLGIALAEMALAGGVGASIDLATDVPLHAFLFGEDQGRYVLTCRPQAAADIVASGKALGILCQPIGTTGGDALTIPGGAAILLSDLRRQHDSWLPDYMQGQLILEEHA